MNSKHITGILAQYIGRRDQLLGDIEVYSQSVTGIGDHGNIGDTIREIIEEVDTLDSQISTMQRYFSPPSSEEAILSDSGAKEAEG